MKEVDVQETTTWRFTDAGDEDDLIEVNHFHDGKVSIGNPSMDGSPVIFLSEHQMVVLLSVLKKIVGESSD